MKKFTKKLTAASLAVVSALAAGSILAACDNGEQNNKTDFDFYSGPEYVYSVTPEKGEKYEFTGNVTSTVTPDGVTIDGVFDEAFYAGKKWFKGNKVTASGETGTLEMVTHFTKTGIVVAAKIRDSRPAIHSSWVETGNVTCFNGYFAFGDASVQSDGVYEVECTAGNRFKISQFTPNGIKNLDPDLDKTPVSAVKREGDIKAGTCYNYDVEYFMPYSLFGRDSRPAKIFFNPTMISSTLDETGNYIEAARTWYNFGYRQMPNISKWGNPDQGVAFDQDGFICDDITIDAQGGKVEQIYGNVWCISGDTVEFDVKPENGKALASLTVNGADRKADVKNGKLSVYCTGDINIVARFE